MIDVRCVSSHVSLTDNALSGCARSIRLIGASTTELHAHTDVARSPAAIVRPVPLLLLSSLYIALHVLYGIRRLGEVFDNFGGCH